MREKPVIWLGDSREKIRAFPEDVRMIAGFQMWRVQRGLEPTDWKPMPSVGLGVQEIRIHTGAEHRVLYVARFAEAGSRGDVFRDLRFSPDEAAYLKVRSELMVKLQKAITARGLKQADAAKRLGVTQPRVSDLMRGRIDLSSIDTLIDMLARLGIRTKLVLLPSHRRAGVA